MAFGPFLLLALMEGMVTAAVLALSAVGLSLVFGVMRVVNVAHGEFYMAGAVIAWFVTTFDSPFSRALALDPELLFLDEPTAGLDPVSAEKFDQLIKQMARSLGLTVFLVTHDLDTLHAVCDRVAVLYKGKVAAIGTIDEIVANASGWVEEYFMGPRGRAAERAEPRVAGG